jgi:hypothetical protein
MNCRSLVAILAAGSARSRVRLQQEGNTDEQECQTQKTADRGLRRRVCQNASADKVEEGPVGKRERATKGSEEHRHVCHDGA